MSRQRFVFPRIRLTKTDKSRLILSVDSISAIEESRQDRCTKVYTIDGFWYDVVNPILEVDAKIEEALERANNQQPRNTRDEAPDTTPARLSARQKRKLLVASGSEKPERRIADSVSESSNQNRDENAQDNPTASEGFGKAEFQEPTSTSDESDSHD